jgi:uncharacterized protein DUF6361
VSSFTWLAHSEAERRRTLDVIRLLEEPGTLDEIGIGGIRDAFAELLFPGTSTIQTRARYFLFIPWLYRDLEGRAPVADAAGRARRAEVQLIEALMATEDTEGVIGREARAALKRLPSAVYWQGLESWGIRRMHTSLSAYHRRLERFSFGADPEGEAGRVSGLPSVWHAELPEQPSGFPREAGLVLTLEEADYLRDRVMTRHPRTLLATLIAAPKQRAPVAAPWEIDRLDLDAAPAEVREQLRHARAFAELIWGAQLLYNLMLAEQGERDEEIAHYGDRLAGWAALVVSRESSLGAWNEERSRFWEIVRRGNPRLRPPAQRFADRWFDLVCGRDPHGVSSDPRARDLISQRELALKKRLARLHNPTALEAWGGVSGAEMLRFRWPQAQALVADIVAPNLAVSPSRHFAGQAA